MVCSLLTLAKARTVIIFDNECVGRSACRDLESFHGWANDLIFFVEALGLRKADLLEFSIGGYHAQMTALAAPHIIRIAQFKRFWFSRAISSSCRRYHSAMRQPFPAASETPAEAETSEERPEFPAFSSSLEEDDKGRDGFGQGWSRVQKRNAGPLHPAFLERNNGDDRQLNAELNSFR